ncbi:MAG: M23 family peptidase, partial [Sulfuricurvum sp.]|nr:M23 family peptidase [Sulfuricurvum sp.]
MRRRNSGSGMIGWALGLAAAGAIGFMTFSPMFERNDPTITVSHDGYWNFQEPIHVSVADES